DQRARRADRASVGDLLLERGAPGPPRRILRRAALDADGARHAGAASLRRSGVADGASRARDPRRLGARKLHARGARLRVALDNGAPGHQRLLRARRETVRVSVLAIGLAAFGAMA